MTDHLYIVSAYGDFFGVESATMVAVPEYNCCDAEALEDYLNADPDLCVKADARLIAAAPELLAALESAQAWIARAGYTDRDKWQSVQEQARAAIAKAKGK